MIFYKVNILYRSEERFCILFSLAVKAACLVLGALGVAGMWVAIFADVGVMILAVLNSARALSIKK